MNKLVSKKSYGRGKYTPSLDYLDYIEFIADSINTLNQEKNGG